MAELFAEFEVELRQAYTLDAAEREQPAPSEVRNLWPCVNTCLLSE